MSGVIDGKVALVTGAAGGLGSGIATCLARDHAVLLTDVNAVRLAAVTEEIAAKGGTVASTVCDVTDRASVQAAFAVAKEQLGEVSAVANVAGVGMYRPFSSLTEQMWDHSFAVNARGTFLVCQTFMSLRANRPGAIVNISSIGARLGMEMLADYGAAKAAVIELSHSLARIGAPTALRVNTVMPGLIWTDMWREAAEWLVANGFAAPGETPEALFNNQVQQMVPMKRAQTAADIGEMVAFLLSDKAGNITGQTIAVDGGALMT